MKKYLVTKTTQNETNHVYFALGDGKECSVAETKSLCGTEITGDLDKENAIVTCKAKPGMMAILSRKEQSVCLKCIDNL